MKERNIDFLAPLSFPSLVTVKLITGSKDTYRGPTVKIINLLKAMSSPPQKSRNDL